MITSQVRKQIKNYVMADASGLAVHVLKAKGFSHKDATYLVDLEQHYGIPDSLVSDLPQKSI